VGDRTQAAGEQEAATMTLFLATEESTLIAPEPSAADNDFGRIGRNR
jgi:hypothetical protein